jgi:hypothetical protein
MSLSACLKYGSNAFSVHLHFYSFVISGVFFRGVISCPCPPPGGRNDDDGDDLQEKYRFQKWHLLLKDTHVIKREIYETPFSLHLAFIDSRYNTTLFPPMCL